MFTSKTLHVLFFTSTGLREYFSQTDERTAAPRIPVMVNMTSVSSSAKKSQKLQSSSVHHSPSHDQMNAANKNGLLMDEYSDEDEDLQYADQEVFIALHFYNIISGFYSVFILYLL